MKKNLGIKIVSVIAVLSILMSVMVPLTGLIASANAPALPEKTIAVIDEIGYSQTVGDYYNYLWDRLYKATSTTDLSTAEYIEFDLKSSDYDALKAAGDKTRKNLTFVLVSNFTNTRNKWVNRNCAFQVFDYETGVNGDWHHFRIPKTGFTYATENADWSKVDFWMFGFWNGTEATGELANVNIEVKNICGTSDKPLMPKNPVAVLDEVGGFSTIGDQYVYLCDRLYKTVEPVDISTADYIEFDLQYDDYIGLTSAADSLDIYITFNLSSSDNKWKERMRTNNINMYATSGGKDGWYHFRIPIADFIYVNEGPIDWTAVKTWFFGFEGLNIRTDAGAFRNHAINAKNICATKASDTDIFRPELNDQALYIVDQLGIVGNLAKDENAKYSDISNTFTGTSLVSGNLTSSKKVCMDVYVDDIDALPSNLSIAFGVKDDEGYRYSNEIEILNQITKDGWNKVEVLVKNIITSNPEDTKNIASWRISTNDTNVAGDNFDCRLWVANIVGMVNASAADMPENATVIIDETGVEAKLGLEYVYAFDRYFKAVDPVDLSNVYYIEFDAHFGNFIEFSKDLISKKNWMGFHLTSSGQKWTNRYFAMDISKYGIESENGWWHFKIPKSVFQSANVGDIDWKKINLWMFGIDGEGMRQETGAFQDLSIKIMNICGTPKIDNELFRPAVASDAVGIIDQFGVLGTLGENSEASYDKLSNKFTSNYILNSDLTGGKYISMQVYIDNVKALPKNLKVSFGVNEGEGYRYLNEINIEDQIKKNGWNEVVIPTASIISDNAEDLKNIAVWKLVSNDTSKVGDYAQNRLWITNIITIVDSTAPELPKNIIATLNFRGLKNTPGSYYSWLADRMYVENLGPFNISAADYMEFDFYVEDSKALKDALEKDGKTLEFSIGSGDPEKYVQSRYFDRLMMRFDDQIKADGWNHIKLPIGKMVQMLDGGPINLKQVRSFMLTFFGGDIQVESSAIANNTFKIINVCATTQVPYIYIEPDKNKPFKPDNKAVYISQAEALFDDYGTWNPSNVTVDDEYKTEGDASISVTLFDQMIRANQLRYLFNDTADISDIDTLEFDFFVSDINLLKSRAKMSVAISSDVRGIKDNYVWKLDLNKLKNGWNKITIDVDKNFTKSGRPNLAKVKSIVVQCDEATFKSDEYVEKVNVKIDNFRYISKTGNKELNINLPEDEDIFDDMFDDFDEDIDFDITDDEIVEKDPTNAPVVTDTKIVKKTVNNVVIQYTWLIIALAAEALVVATVIVISALVKSKKSKRRN